MRNLSRHLNFKSLVSVTAVMSLINGIFYLFFTRPTFAILGIRTNEVGLMITRYYGASTIGYAFLLWPLRDHISTATRRSVLFSITLTLGMMTIVGIWNPLDWVFWGMGIMFVVSDLLLCLGSIYLLLKVK